MSDVFILGAGFSRAVSLGMKLEMPLLVELADKVEEVLIANNTSHPVCGLFPRDLELWLSFLLDDHPWLTTAENEKNKQTGLLMLSTIRNRLFVSERMVARPPEWFWRLVTWWHATRASVLTLNYDTLIERCAASFDIRSENLYPVRLIPLQSIRMVAEEEQTFSFFKLHGSASWFAERAGSSQAEGIHCVSFASWIDEALYVQDMIKNMNDFIVPPRFNKAIYLGHQTMHSLWSLAAEALHAADRVFVLGYSLPPTDLEMRYFLASNSRRHDQEVYVADRNPEVVRRFGAIFGDTGIRFNAFGSGDDGPIPPLAEALYSGPL
ncbi:MAG TPA: hypothetical protein VMP11_18010 [Verrucomicrobiae bacterium]|nr:hypothetical protein [Verrucomicrobiae bacterium]